MNDEKLTELLDECEAALNAASAEVSNPDLAIACRARARRCGLMIKELKQANDAHCLACDFKMVGGARVGLCPKCGSERWYKTRLTPRLESAETGDSTDPAK